MLEAGKCSTEEYQASSKRPSINRTYRKLLAEHWHDFNKFLALDSYDDFH